MSTAAWASAEHHPFEWIAFVTVDRRKSTINAVAQSTDVKV